MEGNDPSSPVYETGALPLCYTGVDIASHSIAFVIGSGGNAPPFPRYQRGVLTSLLRAIRIFLTTLLNSGSWSRTSLFLINSQTRITTTDIPE